MADYDDKLKGLATEYRILMGQLKKIYPLYHANEDNAEYETIYNTILSRIQNVFSRIEKLDMDLDNMIMNDEFKYAKLTNNLKKSKSYYRKNKPRLQQIIDRNSGSKPREEEIAVLLENNYFDCVYIILLLGVVLHSFRKLVNT